MRNALRTCWQFIRALATDDAYERYLHHHCEAHGGAAPLSRRAFWLREQQQKWSGVQRCC